MGALVKAKCAVAAGGYDCDRWFIGGVSLWATRRVMEG